MNIEDLPPSLRDKIRVLGHGCWEWTRCLDRAGYGSVHWGGATRRAHRVTWELLRGPFPLGKVSDHLCHDPRLCVGGPTCPHRRCVNPAHIQPTTRSLNSSPGRASHAGTAETYPCEHPRTPANTNARAPGKRGGSRCRICNTEAVHAWLASNHDAQLAGQRRWREANRDARLARRRDSWAANRAALNAKQREQRHADLDKARMKHRAYWAANVDAINAKRRAKRTEAKEPK